MLIRKLVMLALLVSLSGTMAGAQSHRPHKRGHGVKPRGGVTAAAGQTSVRNPGPLRATTSAMAVSPKQPRPSVTKTVVFIGSSVCDGSGATDNYGWAQQFAAALAGRGWDSFNVSVPGDNTLNVINRFNTDVTPLAPNVVVVGLSLNNEGLGNGNDPAVYQQFTSDMITIVSMIQQIGAAPVIAGTYPNDGYAWQDADYLHSSWNFYDQLGVPWIDFASLDDRCGNWFPGISADGTHPDDQGHSEMYHCASPSLLDAMAGWDPTLIVPSPGSINTGSDTSTPSPISVTPIDPMSNFTLFLRVRNGSGSVGLNYCGVGGTAARIGAPQGAFVYSTSQGDDVVSTVDSTDAQWHSLCIAHEAITNTTRFYVDGVAIGDAVENLVPTTFAIGGRSDNDGSLSDNAANTDIKDILIYRTRLLDNQVQALDAGTYSIGSLEVFAPCSDPMLAGTLLNLAPTDSVVTINSPTIVPGG